MSVVVSLGRRYQAVSDTMAELAAVDGGLLLEGRMLEAARAGDEARLQHVLEDWALVHPRSHLAPDEHDGLSRSLRRALLEASQRGHEGVVRVLLLWGAVPDPRGDHRDEGEDEYGRSALVCACLGGHIGVVKELLQAGADVCARGRLGYTSLVAACSGNRADIVALLLPRLRQHGVGEEARVVVGEALWWCCVWGHEGLACLLLCEGGADPHDATGAGTCVLSPSQVAAQCGQRRCLQVIQVSPCASPLSCTGTRASARESGSLVAIDHPKLCATWHMSPCSPS